MKILIILTASLALASARTVCEADDQTGGIDRGDKEIWIKDGWWMQCTVHGDGSWTTEPIQQVSTIRNCPDFDLTNYEERSNGEAWKNRGTWYKCTVHADGSWNVDPYY